ncbi:MAG: phosphoribosyltransferase [Archangium sp.]
MAFSSLPALAQYTPAAGHNAPAAAYEVKRSDETGKVEFVPSKTKEISKDPHGNARGDQYDLAIDGAFEGQTVLIIDQTGNTLVNTRAALKLKGLNSVVIPNGLTPPIAEFKKALSQSCQVWLISNGDARLSDAHIAAIKAFFDEGHGVYLWGDNEPLYVDTNRIANALVPGLRMEGNLLGEVAVGISQKPGGVGLKEGHLITTGLEHLYEGTSIATVQFTAPHGRNAALYDGSKFDASRAPELPPGFTAILYGSAGNLVNVAYEKDGKRLLMDGGFTRLAVSWDDAGTARYVKNAASWLVNAERFPQKVATVTTATPATKKN